MYSCITEDNGVVVLEYIMSRFYNIVLNLSIHCSPRENAKTINLTPARHSVRKTRVSNLKSYIRKLSEA